MSEERLVACPVESREPQIPVLIDRDQYVFVRRSSYVDTVSGMIEHLRVVHNWSAPQIREWLSQNS